MSDQQVLNRSSAAPAYHSLRVCTRDFINLPYTSFNSDERPGKHGLRAEATILGPDSVAEAMEAARAELYDWPNHVLVAARHNDDRVIHQVVMKAATYCE